MSRNSRSNNNSSYFHIMSQGINREYIFNDICLKEKYKSLMIKYSKENNVNILSYCIMNNHVHILIYTDSIGNMSKFMHSLNGDFAEYYNWKKNRKGYVFRDRYKSEAITSLRYLRNCMVYIHKNPVVGKIVDKMEKYKYSSYNDFIKKTGIVNKENLELIFGTTDAYINIFNELHSRKCENDFLECDLSEEEIKYIIDNILQDNNVRLKEVSSNKKLLSKVVVDIKRRTKISNTQIGKIIGINRMKVQRIIKNENMKLKK